MKAETTAASGETSAVQAADRVLQILEILADNGPTGVSAIARELGVHRSTAFRLLSTLEGRRFVVQETHRGTYSLGAGALRIAGAVALRIDLAREAQEICDEVTARLGETSNVAILVEDAAVNIAQATGTSSVAVRDQYVGQRTPLHATSSGKALLAFAGEAAIEVAAGSLERFSDTTITDPAKLRDELALVRGRGWASALAEWQDHTNAVAVPVLATDGSVVAALSITAPAFRLPPEALPGLAEELHGFAQELARRLGHLTPR
jgi:DNA-binding IclR family transcriptional regulator